MRCSRASSPAPSWSATATAVTPRWPANSASFRPIAGPTPARDFVDCEGAENNPWKRGWLARIAAIYQTQRQRLQQYHPDPLRRHRDFHATQRTLETQVAALFADAEVELAERTNSEPRAEPLRRLLKWRHGLERFVADPEAPIDNNASERSLRAPVISRKISFGNDSWTGARLTAMLYSIFGTLTRHGIDLDHWLRDWLTAAAAAGAPPADPAPWLPWSMTPDRREHLRQPRAPPEHA